MSETHELKATRAVGVFPLLTALILTALLVRLLAHLARVAEWSALDGAGYSVVYAAMFALLSLQLVLASLERPTITTADELAQLSTLRVAVVVPAYNEDPAALRACLEALLTQSRPPQTICVIDDGSDVEYGDVRRMFHDTATRLDIDHHWIRQANAGKRHAQAAGIVRCADATVFVTIDSDSVCDQRAIEEALKPFKDQAVSAVAGVVLAANASTNVLTRMLDLTWTTWQYTERSALSSLGSVMINSGGFALYRAGVVRNNLDGYLNERVLGRPIMYSDDSMLTLYALLEGRVVQQPSAFCFTLVPERLHHHLRQHVRWMRGSAIRSLWRVRYLPLGSVAFWMQVTLWAKLALPPVILFGLLADPDIRSGLWPGLLLVPILVGYIQGLRYLCVRTNHLSLVQRLGIYVLLTPLSVVWSFTALRGVRWYGMLTCLRNEWGTRTTVEVTAAVDTLRST